VHRDADTETLLQGLDFLSQSIEQKSASLKVLVESNFERFVRAKSTIDNVYANMRDQGIDPENTRRPHSRHASRGGHSRGASGPFSPVMGLGAPNKVPTNEKRKNALIKESEYGVLGIKAPLLDVAVKAEEVWGPALGGREKEDVLKSILSTMEKHRGLFEVGPSLHDAIKRQDYDTLVEDYLRAKKYAEEAKNVVDISVSNRAELSDTDTYRVLVTARMWSDVEDQITAFKRDVWKKLAGTHFTKQASTSEDDRPEEHMALINILLELGVDDNPIWVWLASRYDYLKNKITSSSERSKVEIEILRRRLANGEKPSAKAIAEHLRSANVLERRGASSKMDSANVLDFWDYLHESMSTLLSTQGGILGEVVEFWETAKSFIDGKAAARLPGGIDGTSKKHHRLSTDGVRDLRAGATELVGLIREHILTFFTDPPIDDISLLFSPLPPTPETPRTPASASLLSPRSATRFKFDPNDIPPPSPKRGEAWEQHAFWPPNGNALSGVHYLSKILALVGTAAIEMANLSIIQSSPESVEQLKALVGSARENCLRAVCGAWNIDADNCKLLEDWTRIPEKKELTNMPNRFMALQAVLLTNLQKILYIPDTVNRPGPEIVVPPSQKLIGNVRAQFMTSLYKTFSGMVENAEKSKIIANGSADEDIEGITVPARGIFPADMGLNLVDMADRVSSPKLARVACC
jgi:exocyst complex component 2